MSTYPATIIQTNSCDTLRVLFPDVPGCTASGATLAQAIVRAKTALHGHLRDRLAAGLPLPKASALGTLPQGLNDIPHTTVVAHVTIPVAP